MATSAAEKARQAESLRIYTETVGLAAEQSRALAVAQQRRFSDRLAQGTDRLGQAWDRWKQFDEDLAAIAQHLKWGDELQSKTDEESRKVRRQQYARAYLRGRTAAANLDAELADGASNVVLLRDLVEAGTEGAKKVAGTVQKTAVTLQATVSAVSEGVSTTFWVAVAGVIGALLLYASEKGKR